MSYNKEENYCSYSPDKLFGVNHNYGCYLHDRHYSGNITKRKTRKQADIALKNNIYNSYAKQNKRIVGWFVSRTYYIFTRLFGAKFYI